MSEIDDAYDRMLKRIETLKISESTKRLIVRLKELPCGTCEELISELEQGNFEDYHPAAYALPKMELVDRLYVLGLHNLAKEAIDGKYD